MVTPYFFVYEQGRENTQRPRLWQKDGFLPLKIEIPRVQSCGQPTRGIRVKITINIDDYPSTSF